MAKMMGAVLKRVISVVHLPVDTVPWLMWFHLSVKAVCPET